VSSDRQELIRRFAVAIVTADDKIAFRSYDVAIDEVWRIATSLANREPPQPALVTAQELEHTREDWWELQGNVARLERDVQRLSGTVETLEGRIRRAVALLRGATRLDTKAGFMVSENKVDEAIQILEEGSDD
jgi:predicted  nucleic acid-binding Zn-ribbon protein